MMSLSYVDILGTLPVARGRQITLRRLEAARRQLAAAWLAACPIARATTYYFSQSGNDTTGNGSMATPWKTLAKAQDVISNPATYGLDPANLDVALLFNRGTQWHEAQALTISGKVGITIGAYGNGYKPMFSAFTISIPAGTAWTQAVGTDRWSASRVSLGATSCAWIREVANPMGRVYAKCSSTAEVEATAPSFYDDGTDVHINAGVGYAPNSIDYEIHQHAAASGIVVDGASDGIRIDNIVVSGANLVSDYNGTSNSYGIMTGHTGTGVVCVTDCEAYYTGYHAIGHTTNVGAGGLVLYQRCKGGLCQYRQTGGSSTWVGYSNAGDGEIMFEDCEWVDGTLPQANVTYPNGSCIVCHTTTNRLDLLWLKGFIARSSARTPTSYANIVAANVPAADVADPNTFRAFVIDGRMELPPGSVSGGVPIFAPQNVLVANSVFHCRPSDLTGYLTLTAAGIAVNCAHWVDTINQTAPDTLSLIYAATDINTFRAYHCSIVFAVHNNNFRIDNSASGTTMANNATAAHLVNSVLSLVDKTGSPELVLGLNNDATNIRCNAFYNVAGADVTTTAKGRGNAVGSVELTTPPGLLDPPPAAMQRAAEGGWVDVDLFWQPRKTVPDIGAIEAVTVLEYESLTRGGRAGVGVGLM